MGCVRVSPASSLPVFVLVVYVLSLAMEVDPCHACTSSSAPPPGGPACGTSAWHVPAHAPHQVQLRACPASASPRAAWTTRTSPPVRLRLRHEFRHQVVDMAARFIVGPHLSCPRSWTFVRKSMDASRQVTSTSSTTPPTTPSPCMRPRASDRRHQVHKAHVHHGFTRNVQLSAAEDSRLGTVVAKLLDISCTITTPQLSHRRFRAWSNCQSVAVSPPGKRACSASACHQAHPGRHRALLHRRHPPGAEYALCINLALFARAGARPLVRTHLWLCSPSGGTPSWPRRRLEFGPSWTPASRRRPRALACDFCRHIIGH